MMQQALSNVLFPERCFFGGYTYGVQGDPLRHIVMGAMVGLAAPADRPMRILEIGSWIGFSTLTWCEAISRLCPQKGSVLCVDPWESYFTAGDIARDATYEAMDFMGRTGLAYDLFRHNVKFAAAGVQVDHIRGVSGRVLPHLKDNHFDIIYIDGSHYYEDVLSDIRLSHDLLREGGILCGDDLELQLGDCDRAVAESSKDVDYRIDPRTGQGFHPGVTLAVHEAFGEVSTLRGVWQMRKRRDGYEKVVLEGATFFVPGHLPEADQRRCNAMLTPAG